MELSYGSRGALVGLSRGSSAPSCGNRSVQHRFRLTLISQGVNNKMQLAFQPIEQQVLPKAHPPSAACRRNTSVQNRVRLTGNSAGTNCKMRKSFPTDRAASAPQSTSASSTFLQKQICSKQISADSSESGGQQQNEN